MTKAERPTTTLAQLLLERRAAAARDTAGPPRLDLANRLALRPAEAARALGISERKLRQLLPKIPHRREEGVVMIPVAQLQRWLADGARAQDDRADAIAREQLGQLEHAPVTRRP